MTLKRITVYVDEQDLAIVKEAAGRRKVPEAEIIRRGIRQRAREVLCGDDHGDHAS